MEKRNYRTSGNPTKEIHSADGSCFLERKNDLWIAYVGGYPVAELQKRENARTVLRLHKQGVLTFGV